MDLGLVDFVPLAIVVIAAVGVWLGLRWWIERNARGNPSANVPVRRQVMTLLVAFIAVIAAVVAMPISEGTRGQILALLGIVLSAAIALSSTTLLGNLIAGLMLRSVRNFKAGDFIRVEGHVGRVSNRGLFHTEIQTEERDLTTLPNMFLANHPVTTARASGTILSTKVGLGYDVPRTDVEAALLRAVETAGLEQGFVQVVELGDFAVVYRCAGLLTDVTTLVSMRSKLNAAVLDHCHQAGIEIVSPSFMNQRQVNDQTFIPQRRFRPAVDPADEVLPESIVFDKADQAASRETLVANIARVDELIAESSGQLRESLERRRDAMRERLAEHDEAAKSGD
ncbi:MAG: mechanosensitive ion channel domain-containing protein [Actinomycetota bacterium]